MWKFQIKVIMNAAEIFDVVTGKSKKPILAKIGNETEEEARKIRGLSQKYPTYIYIFAPKCSSDPYWTRSSTVKPHESIGYLLIPAGLEQRICIKFCFNLEKTCTETIQMLQKAFGDDCMGKTQIKEWFKRFKNGRTSVASDPRSGRPSTGKTSDNVECVRAAIEQDHRLTTRELEDDLGIPKSTVHRILTEDLGMTRVCAKFIPKLLSEQQKSLRLEIAQDNLEMINSDENFLKKVITGDESWVYGYDPETKKQSSQWKHASSPRPKKARQNRSKIKSMLIVFFDYEGVVYHEYAPAGQTINKEYYVEILKRLHTENSETVEMSASVTHDNDKEENDTETVEMFASVMDDNDKEENVLKSEINFDVPTVSITDISFVDPSLEPENGNLNNVFDNDPAQICNITNLTFEMTSKILELGPCQPEPIELLGGNYPQINGHRFLKSLYYVILADGSTVKRDWLTYSKSKTRILTIKRKEHVYANREIVKQLIDITLYIGRHNLAFRGHRENWHCSLKGNFKDLCSLLSKHSPTIANYMGQLEGLANNKKPQYSFISWRRQNDVIDSISYYIKHKVTNSIKKTRFFSIAIDSTFDVSHREQVSFIVRYIDDDSCNIQERLIGLRDISKTTGYNLFQIFKEVCSSNGLNWTENLIGQSYDGASNMRGQYNGLQKYIRDENS
ncbi:hypothetical protein QTP88_020329 [Uroleucon formosanum]